MRFKLIFIILTIALSFSIHGEEKQTFEVADMEKETAYMAFPVGRAKISFSDKTSSQGKSSLRFQFSGASKDRASIVFPFKNNMKDYDIFAFDFYCENNNGATMAAYVNQEVKNTKKEGAESYSYVNLMDGRDGWVTIRLRKKDFMFREKGGYKQDWSKVKSISFGFGRGMQGKMVVYFDKIRFEKSDNNDSNLILNSSFEQDTSPGTPDYWHRDINIPPFGKNIWGLDTKTAFKGNKSLRLGLKGKYAAPGGATIRVVKGKDYTLSFYMKSDKDSTQVGVIGAGSLNFGSKKKIFRIGKNWKRYSLTGKANGINASFTIELLSADAAVWLDAVQFVEGDKPLPYIEPVISSSEKAAKVVKTDKQTVSVTLNETLTKPVIDGKLNEDCWEKAALMKDFVKLKNNSPSQDSTISRATFDDEALYISVEAKEKDMARVKKMLELSQKGPWGTDLIEVFINFNNDGKNYYQFVANAKGQKSMAAYNKPRQLRNWICEWSAAGKLYKDRWTLEMKIPYTCFDLSKMPNSGEIGINICRTSMRENKLYSSWAFANGSFHNTDSFGKLRGFKSAKLKNFMIDTASLVWKYGKAGVTLKNNTGKDFNLKVTFTALDTNDNKIVSKVSNIQLKSGETAEVISLLQLKKDGLYRLSVSGIDTEGILRFISQNKAVKVSGASFFEFHGSEYDFYSRDKIVEFRCFIDTDTQKCKSLSLKWQLTRNNKTVLNGTADSLETGFNYWKLPLAKLDDGTYHITVELLKKGKVIASGKSSFRKLPPAKQEMRINQWGRFLVQNGTAFLPYGFYDNSMTRGQLADWKAVLEDTQKANCTAHLVYMGNNPDVHKKAGEYLDAAAAKGQKIWVHLSGMFAWHIKKYAKHKRRYFSEAEAMEGLREVVLKYKDHPALIGWCTLDEPGNRPHLFTNDVVKKYYDEVKKLDPHHPCIISHITHLGESKIYGDATDLAVIPFMPRGGRYDYLFQELWNIGKPIITNSPCYGGIGKRKNEPTPAEQRIAIYKALILGARGICSYTYRPTGPALWNEFIEIGKELEYLSPALLTPDEKLKLDILPEGQNIYAVLKRNKNIYYLIVVNTAPFDIDAKITLPGIRKIVSAKGIFKTPDAKIDNNLKIIKMKMLKQSTAVFEIK